MEIKAKIVQVYGKSCIGCQRHEADVMVSVLTENGGITDIFLSQEEANRLGEKLALANK